MGDGMVQIKESSRYDIYDEKGVLIKGGFKDIQDAYEKAINILDSKPELKLVKIKAEIVIQKKK